MDCFTPLNFCAVRFTRLNVDGTVDFGVDVVYTTGSGIDLGAKATIEKAKRFTATDGCGNLCGVADNDCDRVTDYSLALELCKVEFGLGEMLAGGALMVTGGTVTGVSDRSPTGACTNGVVTEGYMEAWNGDQRALHPVSGQPAWFRYGFPLTRWTFGDDDHKQGFGSMKLQGKALPNSQAGLGPDCDWEAVPQGPRFIDLVDALPTAACDYGDLVACS